MLASVFSHAPDGLFGKVLHRLLELKPGTTAEGVILAGEEQRAGRCTRPDDWVEALKTSDAQVRRGVMRILPRTRSDESEAR